MTVIDDDLLDRLGEYFVRLDIGRRYHISFETFVRRVLSGTWTAYLAD